MPGGRDIVFIIDADHAVRDALCFTVELDGFAARICGSVAELLAHPERGEACCAVIDGMTLNREGPEVLAILEAARGSLPIVLTVDHVSRRLLARTVEARLFHVVEKPVLDDALLRCVRALLRDEDD